MSRPCHLDAVQLMSARATVQVDDRQTGAGTQPLLTV
jgi:hypothetical protein